MEKSYDAFLSEDRKNIPIGTLPHGESDCLCSGLQIPGDSLAGRNTRKNHRDCEVLPNSWHSQSH
jgi:hypothetical protein